MMKKLLKLALFLLFVVLSISCATQRRCNAKFPPQVIIERNDSIIVKDSIIYRTLEVPIYIKGETITRDSLIPGIPEKINTKPITLENTYAVASAWIENSRLKIKLDQKDQVIKLKLDSADKISKHWEYKYKNEKQVITLPPEKYVPGIIKFFAWVGGIFLLLVALYIAYKVFRPKI
jgi:hypothetical protein